MLKVTLSPEPAPHTVRKIIQLVVSRNALIALTEDSEIWVLHGFDATAPGSESPAIEWRILAKQLPPKDAVGPLPVAATW